MSQVFPGNRIARIFQVAEVFLGSIEDDLRSFRDNIMFYRLNKIQKMTFEYLVGGKPPN